MPLSISFGGQSLSVIADKIEAAALTQADILYGLKRQKARILDRTARGVDLNGGAFAPYSTKGPYYYYPNKGAKPGQRRASAAAFGKKIGAGTRTRLGLKFASYAAFKASMGRGVVDLLGPKAPHMLQAIVVKTDSASAGTIGIYGPEADRATGHNTGFGHLPKREFFGWGAGDDVEMMKDLDTIMSARLGDLF